MMHPALHIAACIALATGRACPLELEKEGGGIGLCHAFDIRKDRASAWVSA